MAGTSLSANEIGHALDDTHDPSGGYSSDTDNENNDEEQPLTGHKSTKTATPQNADATNTEIDLSTSPKTLINMFLLVKNNRKLGLFYIFVALSVLTVFIPVVVVPAIGAKEFSNGGRGDENSSKCQYNFSE